MNGRPASILVIDDEHHMRELLEIGLVRRGFQVHCAPDGPAGLKVLERESVDLIVLDLMLPNVDGIAMLPVLRRATEAPIVMLSARGEVESRVAGLEAGADDYVAKPFDFDELAARVKSALRRPALKAIASILYADLAIDLERRTVTRGGEPIDLSAREFELLATMARTPLRVYTRQQLIDLVWGAARDVSPFTIDSYISYLRAKIDKPPHRRLIQTIRGVGYSVR